MKNKLFKPSELEIEDLKKICEKDNKFRDCVENFMESQLECIYNDVLIFFTEHNSINWDLPYSQYETVYFKIDRLDLTVTTALKNLMDNFNLDKNVISYLKRVCNAYDRFYLMQYDNKNYDILETWLDDQCDKISNAIQDLFQDIHDREWEESISNMLDCEFLNDEEYRFDLVNDKMLTYNVDWNRKWV